MNADYERLRHDAEAHGQGHLLRYWGELDEPKRKMLLLDLACIDFSLVGRLAAESPSGAGCRMDVARVEPPQVYPSWPESGDQAGLYEEARRTGQELLASGKVAAMVVAGGQGTRLGFDGPKGTYPISPVMNKTLFQLFAESILATNRRYGCRVAWYVMTSDATDEPTRRFFEDAGYFRLDRADVRFFKQGVMPAVDENGKILLAEKHRVALSPNGHGGSLTALRDGGVLADMKQRRIDVISYFQVDNPLVSPADPLFIGLHMLARSQISSIAVAKADDLEKVGTFVQYDGKLRIIEYTDLAEELARARRADGTRKFNAGSVAIHLLCPRFVGQLTGGGALELPWHIAYKKVPFFDPVSGRPVEPDRPNARKFERFIFDAIPLADRSIVLEQPRCESFSPVKNAEGVDSAQTARRDMVLRAMSWLEDCGVSCPRTAQGEPAAALEISPLRALDRWELRERLDAVPKIKPGDRVYLV